MALNGIDAQIMTQRVMDVAKDASVINKKNELMQDFMAVQRKAEDELRDSSVTKLERKDDPRITKEHGSQNGAGYEPYEGKEKTRPDGDEEADEDEEPGIVGSHKIDVRI
jgi:hypothetical protein